jgi:hypothetical protein
MKYTDAEWSEVVRDVATTDAKTLERVRLKLEQIVRGISKGFNCRAIRTRGAYSKKFSKTSSHCKAAVISKRTSPFCSTRSKALTDAASNGRCFMIWC